MIRGIVFDCFGVLYGGSLSTIISLCPEERLQDLRDFNKRADYGFIETSDYIAALADLLGRSTEDIEDLLRHKHQRNEDLIEFVRELKRSGMYKICLLYTSSCV